MAISRPDLAEVTERNDSHSMDVRVENNLLTIRTKAAHVAPGDPIYHEYGMVTFFRRFGLNERVDQSKLG
jgi:HSP20 family molecular chaperone IbpA